MNSGFPATPTSLNVGGAMASWLELEALVPVGPDCVSNPPQLRGLRGAV